MPKLKAATEADGTKFYPVTITKGVYDIDKSQALSATLNSKYEKPANGIPKSDLNSGVRTSLNKADSALQSETDPIFTASAAYGITSNDISTWNNCQANVIESITMNGTAVPVSNKVAQITAPVIPNYSSADAGKVLSVNSSGVLVWATPVNVYSGTSAPDNSQGVNGDIYIQV